MGVGLGRGITVPASAHSHLSGTISQLIHRLAGHLSRQRLLLVAWLLLGMVSCMFITTAFTRDVGELTNEGDFLPPLLANTLTAVTVGKAW